MKKGPLLQAQVSHLIAQLGHTDRLAISDAGLPIPAECQRIDLALTTGIPSFMQVLQTVGQEMQVEQVIIAQEIKTANPFIYQQIMDFLQKLEQQQSNRIEQHYVSHEAFKQQTQGCKGIIRSGECSAYANIILIAGVTF